MAFSLSRASTKWWRSIVNAELMTGRKPNQSRHLRSFTTCTPPKFAPVAADAAAAAHSARINAKATGEWIPIYMLFGFMLVAVSVGVHTAKQQLLHSPVVQISKKKREMVPEVDNPSAVISSSGNFVNKSFLRKVAHIQDAEYHRVHSSARAREVESLESAGVAFGKHR